MSTSIQEFEGSGTLSAAVGDPETSVTFAFNIRRTFLDSRPRLPPRPPKAQGRGTVVASDGRVLSEGIYHLLTSNGQQIRVQKLGPEWHMLSIP
jgi:hypothetical protein